jgi:hypothetical protein
VACQVHQQNGTQWLYYWVYLSSSAHTTKEIPEPAQKQKPKQGSALVKYQTCKKGHVVWWDDLHQVSKRAAVSH